MSDIVDFSLDSSLDIINDEAKNETEAVTLVIESMDRATTKVKEIGEQVYALQSSLISLAESTLRDFNSNLFDLTNNENIYDIRFRLAKAKAIAKTSALKTKAFEKIALGTGFAANKGLKAIRNTLDYIWKLTTRFSKKVYKSPISTDVSNFLAESENRIKRLPFVYQRLFSSEPVSDKKPVYWQGTRASIT